MEEEEGVGEEQKRRQCKGAKSEEERERVWPRRGGRKTVQLLEEEGRDCRQGEETWEEGKDREEADMWAASGGGRHVHTLAVCPRSSSDYVVKTPSVAARKS